MVVCELQYLQFRKIAYGDLKHHINIVDQCVENVGGLRIVVKICDSESLLWLRDGYQHDRDER